MNVGPLLTVLILAYIINREFKITEVSNLCSYINHIVNSINKQNRRPKISPCTALE